MLFFFFPLLFKPFLLFLFSALFFPDFAAEERFVVLFFPAAVLLFAVVFFLPDAKKSTSAS